MGFWVFMLIMVLLTPLTMIVFGAIFVKNPPAKINSIYGYKTKRSMKNTKTWIFAHHYAGRILFVTGVVITIPSVMAMAFVFHREIDTVGWTVAVHDQIMGSFDPVIAFHKILDLFIQLWIDSLTDQRL